MCQKSQNFVDAFMCYKQKCKVVSLNLANPVRVAAALWTPTCHIGPAYPI